MSPDFVELKDRGKLQLRLLQIEDASAMYVDWMNDPEVVRYLESRDQVHTIESIRSFIEQMGASERNRLFGIFITRDTTKHVGNIKIGDIDPFHRRADVGFLIGDKSEWGKGCATAAVSLATDYAFSELNLNKVWAGVYSSNVGSLKAMLRAGWNQVGTMHRHARVDGLWEDKHILEKINTGFKE